jgi:hypothetical protein
MLPKYFKLSQTKTQSRILNFSNGRPLGLLPPGAAPPPPPNLAMPQVGGNTYLTRCGIYISYSLKTSTQDHNLELKQPHKYINLGTKGWQNWKFTNSIP